MALRLLMLLCVTSAACKNTGPFEPLPDDPRLGKPVLELPALQNSLTGSTVSADGLYIVNKGGGGYDRDLKAVPAVLRVVHVDATSGVATELPAPPIDAVPEVIGFGLMHGPGFVVRFDSHILVWDGAWTALPARPEFTAGTLGFSAFSKSNVVVALTGALYRWDGAEWKTAPIAGMAGRLLGPDDASTIVVIEAVGSSYRAAFYDRATLQQTDSIDVGGSNTMTSPQNGTPADFVVPLFVDGDLTDLVRVTNRVAAAPVRAHGTIHPRDGAGLLLMEQAVPGGSVLLNRFDGTTYKDIGAQTGVTRLSCECDRNLDAKCACLARSLALTQIPRSLPGEGPLPLVLVDDVDARVRIFVKTVPLPSGPPIFDGPLYDAGLTPTEMCVADMKTPCSPTECVDLKNDPMNCGACAHTCPGQSCINGACACLSGETFCNGTTCRNTTNDPANCGACDFECQVNGLQGSATCNAGHCRFQCAPGVITCSPTIHCDVNGNTDPLNCGTCGHNCNGMRCQQGQCVP